MEQVELTIRFGGYMVERVHASVDLDDPKIGAELNKILRGAALRHGRGDTAEYVMRVAPRSGPSFTHVAA